MSYSDDDDDFDMSGGDDEEVRLHLNDIIKF